MNIKNFLIYLTVKSLMISCSPARQTDETASLKNTGEYSLTHSGQDVFSPEIMRLAREQRGSPPICDSGPATREACSVRVYEKAYSLFQENPEWGKFTFGKLLTVVFNHELAGPAGISAAARKVVTEAFVNNLWSKICSGGGKPGCNPRELLIFLASKQAWFNKGLNMPGVYDILKNSIDPNRSDLEVAIDANRNLTTISSNAPNDWGNWAYGKPGYADAIKALNRTHPDPVLNSMPLVIYFCYPPHEYTFAVVTAAQDAKMPGTSSSQGNGTCQQSGRRVSISAQYASGGDSNPGPGPTPLPPNEQPPEPDTPSGGQPTPPPDEGTPGNPQCPNAIVWVADYICFNTVDNAEKREKAFQACKNSCGDACGYSQNNFNSETLVKAQNLASCR